MAAAVALDSCKKNAPQESEQAALGEIPTDQMTYRPGSERGAVHGEQVGPGDQVSILGFGCMRYPTIPELEEEPDTNAIDQEQANALVDYAMAHGVNYYDTSPMYCKGFSEEATGIALSRYPREKYLIATKLSNFEPWMWTREESMKMYKRSFERLRVDYLDYYLLHAVGGGGMERLRKRYFDNGMLDFLLEERKAGRIRNLGFSFHGEIEVFDWLLANHDKYHWDFVQIQYNYVDYERGEGRYLMEELKKRNIPAVIMEPILGGRLASLPDHLAQILKQRDPQRSIASWAFRFAGQEPGVLTVLSGMTYMEHLQDNVRTYAPFKPLSDDEMQMIYDLAHEYVAFPLIPCTGCQYCMPCPYGIDIPTNFSHYNKCLKEGAVKDDANDPEYRRMRRKYLVSYAEELERERQADHCIGCNQCISHCPQKINIPQELQRIDHYVEKLRNS